MERPMDTLSEIQQAIANLSASKRSQLALWIYELRDTELRQARVAEPALAYDKGHKFMTVDEYLAFELQSQERHEYVAGDVFAMSGASRQHNRIVMRLAASIEAHLRGGPCEAYSSDVKVRLKNDMKEHFYYPDLMVVCDRDCDRNRPEEQDTHFVSTPRLIVEVLSPSTENIDRREKSLFYRHIETLEEYVLISQEECEVTIIRREQNWRPVVRSSLEELAEFRSIRLSLPLRQIYHDAPLSGGEAG
jgi:Uma2 family endonuclease